MAQSTAEAFAGARNHIGPLDQKLAIYQSALEQLAPALAQSYAQQVQRLIAGEVGTLAPAIGRSMPDFLLPADSGALVHSQELFARGPTVVSLNRGHWCSFCRLEVESLASLCEEVQAVGGTIISITPESAALNRQLREIARPPLMFLSDLDNAYALQLGLAMRVSDEVREQLLAVAVDLAAYHGNQHWILPIPATFVVARHGCITGRFIDPDFRRRPALDEIRAALATSASVATGP